MTLWVWASKTRLVLNFMCHWQEGRQKERKKNNIGMTQLKNYIRAVRIRCEIGAMCLIFNALTCCIIKRVKLKTLCNWRNEEHVCKLILKKQQQQHSFSSKHPLFTKLMKIEPKMSTVKGMHSTGTSILYLFFP